MTVTPPRTTNRHETTSPACPQSCRPRGEPSRPACTSRRSSPAHGTCQWPGPMGGLWWHPSLEEEQQGHLGPRDSGQAAGLDEAPHVEREDSSTRQLASWIGATQRSFLGWAASLVSVSP